MVLKYNFTDQKHYLDPDFVLDGKKDIIDQYIHNFSVLLDLSYYAENVLSISSESSNDFVQEVCEQLKERSTFVKDMWEEGRYYFSAPTNYDEKIIRKKWKEDTPKHLSELKDRLAGLSDFSSESIELEFKKYLEENELGMGKLLPAFRVSLTGLGMGPSLFDIAALLGKEETIARLETALEKIN